MSYLRNILLILFCWTLGNSVLAASTALLQSDDDASYTDPRQPKIKANFELKVDNKFDLQSSVSPSPAILVERVLAIRSQFYCSEYFYPYHPGFKKQYLFIFSGTSPPSVS